MANVRMHGWGGVKVVQAPGVRYMHTFDLTLFVALSGVIIALAGLLISPFWGAFRGLSRFSFRVQQRLRCTCAACQCILASSEAPPHCQMRRQVTSQETLNDFSGSAGVPHLEHYIAHKWSSRMLRAVLCPAKGKFAQIDTLRYPKPG